MELAALFDALVATAEAAHVVVRDAAFDPALRALSDGRRVRGGLCRVRGEQVILVDRDASLPERIATIAGALAAVRLDEAWLSPVVRATIRAYAPLEPMKSTTSGGRLEPQSRRPSNTNGAAKSRPRGPSQPLARTKPRKD